MACGHASRGRWVALTLVFLSTGGMAAAPTAPLDEIAQVAVGRAHSCALDTAGGVACWGSNAIGQLGLGDTSLVTLRSTAVPVEALGSGNRAIAAGDAHTCVISADRSVRCWGLGIGTGSGSETYAIPTPVAVLGLGGPVQQLSAGAEHSCAVLVDGRVQCWGGNARGQLGDGSSVDRLSAVDVVDLGTPALLVEAGGSHTCAALANGQTRCWGFNGSGQLGDGSSTDRSRPVAVQGLPSAVRSLAAGSGSTCAVTTAGQLFCWGAQFPLAAFDGGSLLARAYPGFESGYEQVDGGSFHYCALRGDGRVKCLGDDVDGQQGRGAIDGSSGAEFVLALDSDIVQVASGGWHSCARSARGGLQCWGRNAEGQLGIDAVNRRLVPTQVAGLDAGQLGVAAGGFHGCGRSAAGGVKCWGFNGNGELGDGTDRFRATPVAVVGLAAGVRALESGDGASCAITAERRVRCWGANFDGRLGNGQTLNSSVPVDVVGLPGDVNAIALGRQHGCALLASGAVRCWGSNEFGQLGDGSGSDRLVATPVQGLDAGVSAIAAGYFHTCAVLAGGIRCWGNNQFGQLGDGSRSNRLAPVAVSNPGGQVLAVEAGIIHTCALLQGGSVSCWGYADFGTLLGDGSTEDRLVPTAVPALRAGVVQIALGGFHSCVRGAAGDMRCWGQGGTIGDNSLNHRPTPVAVAGLDAGVQDISAGFGGQTCAVVNGASRCWGENSFAQVGDGSTHGEPIARRALGNAQVRRVAPLAPGANAASGAPRLAGAGRFLVYESDASNLVSGDGNGVSDIFVLDRETGSVRRASLDADGRELAGHSREPAVSRDGQLVAFVAPAAAARRLAGESESKRLARLKSTGNAVLLRNMLVGSTMMVGPALPAAPSTPQFAASGNALVFTALPTSPTQGSSGQLNVFLVPIIRSGDSVSLGELQCLSCKSANPDGSSTGVNVDGDSSHPVISADGQWVAYQSKASNAVAGLASPCPAGSSQVLLRNMLIGSTQVVSPPASLAPSACGSSGSQLPSIDEAGRTIAFQSDQALVPQDANRLDDVYVWRTGQAGLLLASTVGNATSAAGASGFPALSGDGSQLAFLASAPNLDLSFADNNDLLDLHSVSLTDPASVVRLSRTATGAEFNGETLSPALNFDGSEIAFASKSSNLVGSTGGGSVHARANPLSAPTRSATWWIPSESGWGLSVFQQGRLLAPAWFTYDSDGEPTWFLVSGAFPQPDGSFRGELFRLTGTPYDRIVGPAIQQVIPVGEVTLRYEGEDRLRFDYRVGALQQGKTLRRFPYGPRDFSCAASPGSSRADAVNFTDLWTGAGGTEGWGLTIFHIDDRLLAAWYTYDLDGEAVFFILSTERQADGSFSGGVFRQRNGTPFSLIDGAPPSSGPDAVGTARLRFLDGERAEFRYVLGAVDRSYTIERLQVGDQATVCRSVDAAQR